MGRGVTAALMSRLPAEARRDARLLRWLRREVNRNLRYWRAYGGGLPDDRYRDLIADCKARLDMLTWAEHWAEVSSPGREFPDPGGNGQVRGRMLSEAALVMAAMRRLAQGYRARDGWRGEWDLR